MFDQRLVGAGSYQQSRSGGEPMWRVKLSVKGGEEEFQFERISDGRTLWMLDASTQRTDPRRVDLVDFRVNPDRI